MYGMKYVSRKLCAFLLYNFTSIEFILLLIMTKIIGHLTQINSFICNQIRSVAQSCPTLCHPMNCSTPGFPVLYCLLEFAQTQVHWVDDAIQSSHSLLPPSPPAFSLSQHQGLFQWVYFSHQVTKVLEFQLQHQFSQWIFRVEFL